MTGFKLFIEDPINYLLATIPEAEEHLEKLEGQRVEILIHETRRPFQLHFNPRIIITVYYYKS